MKTIEFCWFLILIDVRPLTISHTNHHQMTLRHSPCIEYNGNTVVSLCLCGHNDWCSVLSCHHISSYFAIDMQPVNGRVNMPNTAYDEIISQIQIIQIAYLLCTTIPIEFEWQKWYNRCVFSTFTQILWSCLKSHWKRDLFPSFFLYVVPWSIVPFVNWSHPSHRCEFILHFN